MKKTLTLAEVKAIYGDSCFETTTSFGVNLFGKYKPNMTFIIPKVFDIGIDEKPISPISYVEDKEITDNMNLNFNGSAEVIFGDFWRSKKGGACFRPKHPMQAKHLLIRVDWGGCFVDSRGNHSEDVAEIPGVLYFRHARSNGGGTGYDFWVVPVGFTHLIYDEEIDGEVNQGDSAALFETRAKEWRKRHSDLQKEAEAERLAYFEELAKSEANREKILPRLIELHAELNELKKQGYSEYSLILGEKLFKIGYFSEELFYNEENLKKAEDYVEKIRAWAEREKAKEKAEKEAKDCFQPKFEGLRARIEALGWSLEIGEKEARVATSEVHRQFYSCSASTRRYAFNLADYEELCKKIEEHEEQLAREEFRQRNSNRIDGLCEEAGLPESLWYLFDRSEDPDAIISQEIKAILAARTVQKTEMDLHELCYCGYERRCEAIHRLLKQCGGGEAKINIYSQGNSKILASYLTS